MIFFIIDDFYSLFHKNIGTSVLYSHFIFIPSIQFTDQIIYLFKVISFKSIMKNQIMKIPRSEKELEYCINDLQWMFNQYKIG